MAMAGCLAADQPQSDGEGAGTQTLPEAATTPPPGAPRAQDEQDPHGDLACDEETLARIDETISGQLEALAAGNYAAALEFASERFRSVTNVQAFRETIETDHPVLINAGSHTSSLCVVQDGRAQLLVSVEPRNGNGVQELVYEMVEENDDWLIDTVGSPRRGTSDEEGDPIEV
jgi:hypothetical protein